MKEEDLNKTTELKIEVSDKAGAVSALITIPSRYTSVATLAHGAGTNMHHDFLRKVSLGFAQHEIATVRFNFPYTEHGKKMPDRRPVATQTVIRVIEATRERFPTTPIYCTGKSFGGRMTSLALSENCPSYVKGIIFFGFPLHPPDNPSVERAQHLISIPVPMLFLQGTRDNLAYMDLIQQTCDNLPLATLIKAEGADHSFNKGKQAVIDFLVQRSAHWMNATIS